MATQIEIDKTRIQQLKEKYEKICNIYYPSYNYVAEVYGRDLHEIFEIIDRLIEEKK